jgi:hypothetical protein
MNPKVSCNGLLESYNPSPQVCKISIVPQTYQGCLCVRASVSSICPSVTSDTVRVRPIRVNVLLTLDRVNLDLLCPRWLPHRCHIAATLDGRGCCGRIWLVEGHIRWQRGAYAYVRGAHGRLWDAYAYVRGAYGKLWGAYACRRGAYAGGGAHTLGGGAHTPSRGAHTPGEGTHMPVKGAHTPVKGAHTADYGAHTAG